MEQAWNNFNSLVKQFPYTSQGIVRLVWQVFGDIIAQVLIEKKNRHTYDYIRSAKFAVFGFLTGLIVYFWFALLDKTVTFPDKEFVTAMAKLAVDQIIFAPLYMLVATGLTGYLQEYKFSGIGKLIKRDYKDLIIANYKVWPAVQFINFYFIPLEFEDCFNAVFAVAWNAYFCDKTYKPDNTPKEDAATTDSADVEATSKP